MAAGTRAVSGGGAVSIAGSVTAGASAPVVALDLVAVFREFIPLREAFELTAATGDRRIDPVFAEVRLDTVTEAELAAKAC